MEYEVKDHIEKLASQRETLVFALAELNENLPNYQIKFDNLNSQIFHIDNQVTNLFLMVKDIQHIKLSNELTIKTTK